MTKADIVLRVSIKTGIHESLIHDIVNSFMTTVKGSLEQKEDVDLNGFGSFIAIYRAPKTVRHFSQKRKMIIPGQYKPIFRPADEFSHRIASLPRCGHRK